MLLPGQNAHKLTEEASAEMVRAAEEMLANAPPEAQAFSAFMDASVTWITPPEFNLMFDALAAEVGEVVDYDTANLQFAPLIEIPLRCGAAYVKAGADPYASDRVWNT